MSRSSSGSWGAQAPLAGDIIDLDRYMRGARPDVHARGRQALARTGQLVVDGGSLTRVTRKASSSSVSLSSSVQPPPREPREAARETPREPRRDKRFSHDSGLSDGSYVRRRHRPHRRASCTTERRAREPIPARASGSSSSRAFRSACARTLRDQQQAITRLAQLCERLERREQTTGTTETSVSSSSRSTADPRRKEKHRTEECKTYKIIMTKLDELNGMLAVRGRSPPPLHPRGPRAAPPAPAAAASDSVSDSVSVSDKVVATEPERKTVTAAQVTTKRKTAEPKRKPGCSSSHLVERAVGNESIGTDAERASERNERNERANEQPRRSTRLSALREVTNAHALDIAPRDAVPRKARGDCPNVLTESVMKCESSNDEDSSSTCEAHCGFDLDNPVHLYAQAKRLQALHATTHRRALSAHSLSPPGVRARARSLCGACRGYWRAIRRCLAAQLCVPSDCV